MAMSYATLEDIRVEAGDAPEPTTTTTYYRNLTEYGIRASQMIDRLAGFTFAPMIDTRYMDAFSETTSAYRVFLNYPLLELTTCVLADDTSLTVATDVIAAMRHYSPKRWLQMLTSSYNFRTSSGNPSSELVVTGVWGWHSDYDNAWLLSGDKVLDAAGLTATAVTITVADADGAGGNGFTPRFSPGNLIKIDSEYCEVVSISSNTLTVTRGARGSTAAVHLINAPISVYFPDEPITRACAKLAVYLYTQRGSVAQVSFEGVSGNRNPPTIIAEVRDMILPYQFIQFAGV